jgi:tetratricopeptide (TPR) repeat protein
MSQDPLIPATVRATALSLLGQYPTEKSLAAFEKSVADEDGLVRLTAVREIPESDPARLVEVLTSLLFDPLKAVRTEAANRLADAPKALLKPYQQEALQKDIDEYIAELNHSLDFAASNHSLGNLYSRMNQPVEAEKYYRRAVSVDDLFYPSKVNLSVILSASGRNDEAEKLLTEVVKAYPEQYDAHYLLGLLLAELGKYQEARDHLAIAAAGMPDHEGAKRNLRAVKEYLEKVQ